jgi:glycosyltransferase involved in cell wall biosynthesis
MRENPEVSVIVPVWNPDSGISRCVESLRGQTLEDIEMIFVDDCGTDGAMEVVRAAAKEDPRIRILENSENLGPGISRNNGIDVARGEYLAFIDADDYVNPVFLERLYTKAVADKLDIVKGKYVYEKEDGTIVGQYELNGTIRKDLKSGKPLFYLFNYQHQSAIYKRTFLMKYGICYGTSYRAEDITFLLKACHKAKAFGFEEDAQYHYCERSHSLVHDTHPHAFEMRLHALREQMDYIVGCMTDEECVSEYFAGRIIYNLMLCNLYRKRPEYGDFVRNLREQVLRFPQLEKLKREFFVVRVLCDYEITLAQWPFKLPWESRKAGDYVVMVSEWIDFVIEHPDCMNDAETDLYRLFREANALCRKEDSLHGAQVSQPIREGLSSQARKLPYRQCERIYTDNPNLPRPLEFVVKRKLKVMRRRIVQFLRNPQFV